MNTLQAPALVAAFLAVLVLGCSRHEPVGAVGANDEISLITNLDRESGAVAEVRRLFSYPVDVVGPERAFRVDYVPFSQFEVHQYVKNQVFAVDMSAGDDLSRALPRILGPRGQERLERKSPFLLLVDDVWATGQTTLFAVGWSEPGLRNALASADSVGLRREYEEHVVTALTKTMFGAGEEESIPAQVAREYGWTMRLPAGFFAAGDPEGRFVKFNSEDPVRLILVHWLPEELRLEAAAWTPVLDRILFRYNDGDLAMPDRTHATRTEFQGEPALRWEGIWQNEKYVIGGPFRAWAFHRGGDSFLVIGQVFAPGQDKVYALRQVEAIVNTFELIR